jgi:DNA-binding XRE family transcriptional regulator
LRKAQHVKKKAMQLRRGITAPRQKASATQRPLRTRCTPCAIAHRGRGKTKKMDGNKIKALRENAGMTQMDLAKAMGVTQAAISHLENQRRGITGSVALSIAAIFQIEDIQMTDDAAARISLMRKIPCLDIGKVRALNTILMKEKEMPVLGRRGAQGTTAAGTNGLK